MYATLKFPRYWNFATWKHIHWDRYLLQPTNSHAYLPCNSFHPSHCRDNIPFNLAKRIIVFVSDDVNTENRLLELKRWLINCGYSNNLINRCFHNAKRQGAAPKPREECNTIPFVMTYISNLDIKPVINSITTILNNTNFRKIKGSIPRCRNRSCTGTTSKYSQIMNQSKIFWSNVYHIIRDKFGARLISL